MNKSVLTVFMVCLIFVFYVLINNLTDTGSKDNQIIQPNFSDGKIVSFSPAITEIVYLLGLEKNLIGVTKYCNYPEQVKEVEQIGGYYDPSIEKITKLQPDCILLGTEHSNLTAKLSKLSISSVTLDCATPETIMDSIKKLGVCFGKEKTAEKVITGLRKGLSELQKQSDQLPVKTVMIVFGGDMADTKNETKCIVGKDFFYTALLKYIGAENVVKDSPVFYPVVSKEGIISLNPDVIIELIPQTSASGETNPVKTLWDDYSYVNAVKNNKVYSLKGDYLFVPGPRFVKIAEIFFSIIHSKPNITPYQGK